METGRPVETGRLLQVEDGDSDQGATVKVLRGGQIFSTFRRKDMLIEWMLNVRKYEELR